MNRKYTDEMIQFLIDRNNRNYSIHELKNEFNECYSMKCTEDSLYTLLKRKGIKLDLRKDARRKYTDEMLDFLRENVEGKTNRELASMMNERFGLNLTSRNVNDMKKDHNIRNHSGFKIYKNSGCFKKGHVPWNNCEVGTVLLDKDSNQLIIKVSNEKQSSVYNYKSLARVIYELHTGETLSSDDKIVFVDGNIFNFSKDNLLKANSSDIIRSLNDLRFKGLSSEFRGISTLVHKVERVASEREKELTNENI